MERRKMLSFGFGGEGTDPDALPAAELTAGLNNAKTAVAVRKTNKKPMRKDGRKDRVGICKTTTPGRLWSNKNY